MEQEDYLMRQINQFSRVLGMLLAGLLGIKNQGEINEAIDASDQVLKKELNLNFDDLVSIPVNSFIRTLLDLKKFNADNLEKLADILAIAAEEQGFGVMDSEKAIKLNERALIIYEYVEESGSTYSFDRQSKINKIKETH
jgi:hypothetical protein